jgi:hypothetical protein
MKIAVCLIVFNGHPYVEKWMKHYTECPDVDYICIAEGATKNMVDVLELETPYSTDNTIETLTKYVSNPKVKIASCSLNFWEEKIHQQNAYMDLVPGDIDYIWVADVDEFYHYADIKLMKTMLYFHEYTFVEFTMLHFFKNVNTIGIGGEGWGYDKPIDRIFKYHPGAKFTSHRPITLLDENGISVKDVKPLLADNNLIRCYHYSYITQKNVYEKMLYYSKTFNRDYINDWYHPVWLAWNEHTKDDIEKIYSIHPTAPGGKTRIVNLHHPIDTSDL